MTVSWYPGFDGGFDQMFLLELRTDFSLNFTVIVPKNETTTENMDYILDNLSSNTAYFIRIFSRNKIGDSNKTEYVAFMTPRKCYPNLFLLIYWTPAKLQTGFIV